jgi:hypothetical protein
MWKPTGVPGFCPDRYRADEPSWSYEARARPILAEAEFVLDMGTGEGGVLYSALTIGVGHLLSRNATLVNDGRFDRFARTVPFGKQMQQRLAGFWSRPAGGSPPAGGTTGPGDR